MKTSKRKVVGIVLIVVAVIGALAIQFFGPGLISTQPFDLSTIPDPPPGSGLIKASSASATHHRWPLMALIALIGAVCYLFPYGRRYGEAA